MLRLSTVTVGLSICLNLLALEARAQMMFPGGYGGYGMSQWGADPSAGYMAGLGSFARGRGAYLLDKAQADAINVDTMAKWNKALRARQFAVREDQQKEAAKRDAARARRLPGQEPVRQQETDQDDEPDPTGFHARSEPRLDQGEPTTLPFKMLNKIQNRSDPFLIEMCVAIRLTEKV